MKYFTPEEDEFIKQHYLTMPAAAIGRSLNRNETSVKQRMALLELVVPVDVKAKFIADSRFKKGNKPFNAGMKQTDYMSAEAIERTLANRFKTGDIPKNSYNQPGKIVIRYDHKSRTDRKYKWICLELGKWKMLHTHIWEQASGKVPKGHCLWFINGDSMDVRLENLECISRKENRYRNAAHQKLTDKYLARCIVGKTGNPAAVLEEKELLKAKKKVLIINRKLKDYEK